MRLVDGGVPDSGPARRPVTGERRVTPRSPGGRGGGRMAVLKEGDHDGTFFGTTMWPELLIGAREIARFFRISPKTCGNWLAQGRLPCNKDAKGRWIVTRRVLEHWMLKGGLEKGRAHEDRTAGKATGKEQMEREERREMGLPPDAPSRGDRPLPMNDLVAQGKTPEAPSVKLPEPQGRWWER